MNGMTIFIVLLLLVVSLIILVVFSLINGDFLTCLIFGDGLMELEFIEGGK